MPVSPHRLVILIFLSSLVNETALPINLLLTSVFKISAVVQEKGVFTGNDKCQQGSGFAGFKPFDERKARNLNIALDFMKIIKAF